MLNRSRHPSWSRQALALHPPAGNPPTHTRSPDPSAARAQRAGVGWGVFMLSWETSTPAGRDNRFFVLLHLPRSAPHHVRPAVSYPASLSDVKGRMAPLYVTLQLRSCLGNKGSSTCTTTHTMAESGDLFVQRSAVTLAALHSQETTLTVLTVRGGNTSGSPLPPSLTETLSCMFQLRGF